MLDVMRKHTKSWLIKVIFAVIILVFVFFFGYSQMQKGSGGGNVAATVNGEPIPYGRYKLALEESREFYKQLFKGDVPEEVRPQIAASALYKVINQKLFAQFAKETGLSVTTQEIYDVISANPSFQTNGEFDPIAYKTNVLPYFEKRFGINFEEMLREELLSSKAATFLTENVIVSDEEAKDEFNKENTTWTFDRIIIPAVAPEGSKYGLDSKEIAGKTLAAIRAGDKANINKLKKQYGLKTEKLDKVNFSGRQRLLPSDPENLYYTEILSLTTEEPVNKEPILINNNYYVFKLTGTERPSEDNWTKEKDEFKKIVTEKKKQEYLKMWQEDLKGKAKIEEFVLNQSQ